MNDWEIFETDIRNAIDESSEIYLNKDDDGLYYENIYVDYSDKLSYETAIKILDHDEPMSAFTEYIYDSHMNLSDFDDVYIKIVNYLKKDDKYSCGLSDSQQEFLTDWVSEHVYFNPPVDHYLDQEFNVPLMIDTGDGNYDYVLNTHYPCYHGGDKGDDMDDEASLVWLAKEQGYSKKQLIEALDMGDMETPNGFLESCRVEMANLPCHMPVLTFLLKINLRTLMKINHLIKIREDGGHQYDATKYPENGQYLTIGKDVECGLYDPWSGGGSVLELQLEKDVNVPIKFIRSCLPDGGDGHGVDSVYGLVDSVWRHSLKEIFIPEENGELFFKRN